jgi:hypothetical protein
MWVTTAQLVYRQYVLTLQEIMVWFLARPRYLALLSWCICHWFCPTERVHQQINHVPNRDFIIQELFWEKGLHFCGLLPFTKHLFNPHILLVITLLSLLCARLVTISHIVQVVFCSVYMLPVFPTIVLGTHINCAGRMFLTTYLPWQ